MKKNRTIGRQFTQLIDVLDLNGDGKREDFIRPIELGAFAKVVGDLPPLWCCSIWLTLLTGARMKSEVLQLRWEDIHPRVGEFTFRETKNGRAHTLPITPTLRVLFDAIPRTSSPWVFPGRKGPLQDSRKRFAKVRKAGFVDYITPHALRHTARTYLEAKLHVAGPVVDRVTNHSTQGMAGRYSHAMIADAAEAMERLSAYIFEHAQIADFAAYLAGETEADDKSA